MFESVTFAIDVEVRSDASNVVVFFPHRWATRKAMARKYGATFAEKYGLNAVLIRSKGPDWFQADDFVEAAQALGEVCRIFDHTTFTGSSMGGYGAIRAAEHYPADLVLAFSPISNIDPSVYPYEKGFQDDYDDRRPFYVPRNHKAARYVVFYDSIHRDRLHLENFALPEARLERAPIPFGGHQTSKIVADAGLLSGVTRGLIAGQDVTPALCDLRRAKRSQATYLLALFRRSAKRRPTVAAWAVGEMIRHDYFPGRIQRFLNQLPASLRTELMVMRGSESGMVGADRIDSVTIRN